MKKISFRAPLLLLAVFFVFVWFEYYLPADGGDPSSLRALAGIFNLRSGDKNCDKKFEFEVVDNMGVTQSAARVVVYLNWVNKGWISYGTFFDGSTKVRAVFNNKIYSTTKKHASISFDPTPFGLFHKTSDKITVDFRRYPEITVEESLPRSRKCIYDYDSSENPYRSRGSI